MKDEIERAIEEIRPVLRADGGDIELVDVTEDGVVKIRLKGACAGCPFSMITIRYNVERYLRYKVPQIKEVIVV
ncbi:MAG: NifU family protein [Candidatus Bathyarchaeia archaeon]|nr:NifU family protein [Candidatus Bathyarchaeota archaeon]